MQGGLICLVVEEYCEINRLLECSRGNFSSLFSCFSFFIKKNKERKIFDLKFFLKKNIKKRESAAWLLAWPKPAGATRCSAQVVAPRLARLACQAAVPASRGKFFFFFFKLKFFLKEK